MRKVRKVLGIIALVVLLLVLAAWLYYQGNKPQHAMDPAKAMPAQPAGNAILDAIGRGADFLARHQEADGDFVAGRLAPHAAFSGLALEVLTKLPADFLAKQTPEYRARIQKMTADCIAFIRTQSKPDGGIYTDIPGYSFGVYSTSVALVALRDAGVGPDDPVMKNAQKYLLASRSSGKGIAEGGAGYQPGTRPDLNNTVNLLEALEASGLPKDDPAYKQALQFIDNCQNRSENNRSGFPVTDDGGFVYLPGQSPAGKVTLADGKEAAASYGTMTYAGLVSFLYSDVDKNDPRVQSAYNWIKKNYDLRENVGCKERGLYYYYRIMAKALIRYGEKELTTADGKKHLWAQDLARTLVSLQKPDGSWVNSSTAYLEGDPVLVTAYALRALCLCYAEGAR